MSYRPLHWSGYILIHGRGYNIAVYITHIIFCNTPAPHDLHLIPSTKPCNIKLNLHANNTTNMMQTMMHEEIGIQSLSSDILRTIPTSYRDWALLAMTCKGLRSSLGDYHKHRGYLFKCAVVNTTWIKHIKSSYYIKWRDCTYTEYVECVRDNWPCLAFIMFAFKSRKPRYYSVLYTSALSYCQTYTYYTGRKYMHVFIVDSPEGICQPNQYRLGNHIVSIDNHKSGNVRDSMRAELPAIRFDAVMQPQ